MLVAYGMKLQLRSHPTAAPANDADEELMISILPGLRSLIQTSPEEPSYAQFVDRPRIRLDMAYEDIAYRPARDPVKVEPIMLLLKTSCHDRNM